MLRLPSRRALRNIGWLSAETLSAFAVLLAAVTLAASVVHLLAPVGGGSPLPLLTGRGGEASAVFDSLSIGELGGSVGLPTGLFLALFVAVFLLPHRRELTLAAARDVLVLAIFLSVSAVLMSRAFHLHGLSPWTVDATILMSGLLSFLVLFISAFGGEWQGSRSVLRELGMVAVLVGAGQLERLAEGDFSAAAIYRYFFEIGVVYVGGLVAKIVLSPEDYVTLDLRSDAKRVLFGLLALLVLLPFAAAALTGLAVGAYALVTLVIPVAPDVTADYPPSALWAIVLVPVGYLFSLVRHSPVGAAMLLAAICASVIRHAVDDGDVDLEDVRAPKVKLVVTGAASAAATAVLLVL